MEIWPESCWQKDSTGKGFAVRRLNKHNFGPASALNTDQAFRIEKAESSHQGPIGFCRKRPHRGLGRMQTIESEDDQREQK